MPFDILQFKEQGLQYGGARPCLFQVTIGQALDPADQFNPGALADFPFLVRAASLPSMVVSPIRVPYFGRHIKVAGNRDFEDWTITVFNDEDFGLRDMFEDWSNNINSLQGNLRLTSDLESQYKSDIEVQQFDKLGNVIRAYNMLGAWPSRVSQIDLDWEAQNQIEVFQVVFSYDYWLPVTDGVGGGASVTASYTGT
jgi:hypothetical protein